VVLVAYRIGFLVTVVSIVAVGFFVVGAGSVCVCVLLAGVCYVIGVFVRIPRVAGRLPVIPVFSACVSVASVVSVGLVSVSASAFEFARILPPVIALRIPPVAVVASFVPAVSSAVPHFPRVSAVLPVILSEFPSVSAVEVTAEVSSSFCSSAEVSSVSFSKCAKVSPLEVIPVEALIHARPAVGFLVAEFAAPETLGVFV